MQKLKNLAISALKLGIRIWQTSIQVVALGVLLLLSFVMAVLAFLATGEFTRAKGIFYRSFSK